MITAGTYKFRAQRAVDAYHNGREWLDYPRPGKTGLCGQAARALWEDLHGRPYPFRAESALAMERKLAKAEWLITGIPNNGNAYHAAVASGRLKPGAQLYMPYGKFGHVVTVVEIRGDPAKSLSAVWVFENTSAVRVTAGTRKGTVISRLDEVCGAKGSNRITGVGTFGI